jgi:probable F420-dependent oxidoreductase
MDIAQLRARVGRVGLWTFALDRAPWPAARDALAELDIMPLGCLWFPEATNRNAFVNATLLLGATQRIAVATGVVAIHSRDVVATANAQRTLAAVFPDRFLLGMGVSHQWLVEDVRGGTYPRPLAAMRSYLERLDAAPYTAWPGAQPVRPRVIAALGPKMLALAAELADGAHPYLTMPEHTARAREILGPDRLLAPDQKVVLATDPVAARATARANLAGYLGQPNYRNSFLRQGFTEADLDDGGSDRLVDGIVAWGTVDAVAARVRAHHDAGADHVAVQLLTDDWDTIPIDRYRALAAALA